MAQARELWLFTARFPKGQGEFSLEHELPHLCRHFSKVRIFPLFHADGSRAIPPNAEVVELLRDPFAHAPWSTFIRSRSSWLPSLKAAWRSAPSMAVFVKRWREVLSRHRQALARTLVFQQWLRKEYDPQRVVMYSNWAEDWATILGMCRLHDPRVRYVTRLRGFDLYDHRAPDQWQMFQRFNLEQASHIYVTSQAARRDVLGILPGMGEKLSMAPTATVDHGVAPWSPSAVFRMVSCSNLYPIKRVHLIAEALQGTDVPVQWIHFGDGAERTRLEKLMELLPPNVKVELKGAVPNARVIAYYKEHPVDLFVHVSSTEGGVAVALQEAASFGIPLLAADAGGVAEVVNEETGTLLPHKVTPGMLREAILRAAKDPWDPQRRARVRAFWDQHFNADRVHERFALDLLKR